jgi:outer membrane protein assembly factor BamB
VFISESYGAGGAMLELAQEAGGRIGFKKLWDNVAFGTHFMSAVEKDGYLYGVDGHGPHDAFLVCVKADTGEEVWRTQPEWREAVRSRDGAQRQLTMGTYRCWLTPVDGGRRFLCLGEFGHLLWLELSPKGHKELARAWLFAAGETWTPPVFKNGLLYISQNTPAPADRGGESPRLRCYDLRAAP